MSEVESHDEVLPETSETQLFSAEYKDGQLQIVEVTPFDKGDVEVLQTDGGDMPALEDGSSKYVQVVGADKSMMQLDLLNLTLVRCEDGVESYRLVSNAEAAEGDAEATVTCVLHSSDNEEAESGSSYVMVDGTQGPLVFLQPAPPHDPAQPPKITPAEILEKAKALQKAKQQIMQSQPVARSRRGRKRKSDLPPPHELLASPNFKLFLYSCKLCTFKCNAIKEMTAHKAAEHSSSAAGGKWRRGHTSTLQCAVCPYRGSAHSQLMKHIQDIHADHRYKNKVLLDTEEVAAADVLVCGACGYESSSRELFRAHIQAVHGAAAC